MGQQFQRNIILNLLNLYCVGLLSWIPLIQFGLWVSSFQVKIVSLFHRVLLKFCPNVAWNICRESYNEYSYYIDNTVVLNHFHSVKNFLFLSAKPHDLMECQALDFRCQCTLRKLQSISVVLTLLKLQNLFTFSVKDRYQLNYFICFKDFNAQTITSLKLNLFYFFIYCCQNHERKTTCLEISVIRQTVRYRTLVFTQPFSWRPYITITYNLSHLRL